MISFLIRKLDTLASCDETGNLWERITYQKLPVSLYSHGQTGNSEWVHTSFLLNEALEEKKCLVHF